MNCDGDRDYFRVRAEVELASARIAKSPEARRAHALLAGYYFDRAFGGTDGETEVAQSRAATGIFSNELLA